MSAKELVSQEFRSSFLEKIERITRWQRIAIVAGVIFLLLGSAYWFLYLPLWDEITMLDERLQGLEKKLATAKINAAELEKFQAKMQEAEANFKIALRALPEKEEIPSLLTAVSKSGLEFGLEFMKFTPLEEKPYAFYAEIPFEIDIRGDFHNISLFFDTVARMSRLVNITGISLIPSQEGQKLNATITALTYKFVEPPPAAPRPANANAAPKPNAEPEDVKSKSKANKKNL